MSPEQSSELLSAIAETTEDAIFATDLDGRFIFFNHAAQRNTGISEQDAIGRDEYALFPPEEAREIVALNRQVMESGRSIVHETAVTLPDGLQHFLVSRHPLRDDGGKVVGMFGVARNITEQKRIEQQLRLWSEAFEHAEFGLAISDVRSSTLIAVNPAFAKQRGYGSEELIGRPVVSLFPADCAAEAQRFISELDKNNHGIYESEHVSKDGRRFPVLLDATVVRSPDGRPVNCIAYVLDISERKRTENALRESERSYRNLFDGMLNGYAHCRMLFRDGDPEDFVYLRVNPAFESLTGLRDVTGRKVSEVAPGIRETDPELFERYGRVARGGAPERFEIFVEALQMWFWISVYSPGPEEFVAVFDVITERKQAELALRESEARIHMLLDSVAEGVYGVDREGLCTFINAAGLRLLGYPHEDELLGREMHAMIHHHRADGSPHPAAECQIYRTAELNQGIYVDDDVFWRKDGTPIPVEYRAHPVQRDGENLGTVVTWLEISERKAAELQTRKLSLAIEQSPESIIITDTQAVIEYVNSAFEQATGYDRSEVLGRSTSILKSGRTPGQTYEELWLRLKRGQVWKGEFINRRKNGSEFVSFAIITPMRQVDGRVSHYVAVQEDITEKKHLGEELDRHRHHLEEMVRARTEELNEARLRAEAATQAKSTFLANMSHEIRTPMNGVLGVANLLRRTGITPQQADYLDKIEASGKHLLGLINDILDLSKIEAGKVSLERKDFMLADLVKQVLNIVMDGVNKRGLRLLIDITSTPQALVGDRMRLSQALVNYVGNSIKFTEHGHIALRSRLLEDSGDGYLIRFEVEDTGIGIDPETKARLFNKFEQADNSIGRKYGGTGLGLAITKKLAGLMGGEAGVESELGRGSTFWFTARLGKGSGDVANADIGSSTNAEAELRKHYAGTRILLVEDDPINQEVARMLLGDVGLLVDLAENGLEAIAKAKMHFYGAILMDLQMPEMGGLEATGAIRALPGHSKTPILALTANAFAEDRQRCLDAGMDDFIAKPFEPESLFKSLLAWLGRAPS